MSDVPPEVVPLLPVSKGGKIALLSPGQIPTSGPGAPKVSELQTILTDGLRALSILQFVENPEGAAASLADQLAAKLKRV